MNITDPQPGDEITVGAQTWHIVARHTPILVIRKRTGNKWQAWTDRITIAQWGEACDAPPPLDRWPDELRELYDERAGIKIDSGISVQAAEAQALLEVWGGRNR